MAQKNNIRSIRFSDDLAEMIDRQVGDTKYICSEDCSVTHN